MRHVNLLRGHGHGGARSILGGAIFTTATGLLPCLATTARYGGNKYNTSTRAEVIKSVGPVGRKVLDLFGYKTGDWGLAKRAPPVTREPRPAIYD